MGINDDDDDDDDEPDKIPTHHLGFCLLGFCPLGLIPTTFKMIKMMILMIATVATSGQHNTENLPPVEVMMMSI